MTVSREARQPVVVGGGAQHLGRAFARCRTARPRSVAPRTADERAAGSGAARSQSTRRGARRHRASCALRACAAIGGPASEPRTDSRQPETRHRFLGFTLLSLSGLARGRDHLSGDYPPCSSGAAADARAVFIALGCAAARGWRGSGPWHSSCPGPSPRTCRCTWGWSPSPLRSSRLAWRAARSTLRGAGRGLFRRCYPPQSSELIAGLGLARARAAPRGTRIDPGARCSSRAPFF